MSDKSPLEVALPDTESAVRKAIEAEQRKVEAWATRLIKGVENQKDRRLCELDRAAAALSPDPQDAQPKAQRTRQKRSPKKAGQSPAALAEKRRQAVHRYLVEQGKPMGFQEIRRSLNISDFSTRSALKRLVADGLVIRTGTGTATRYSAKPHESKASALRPSPKTGDQGTMQGRLLATIQDRGSASVDELAQAVRTPREVVQRECGALIREEEIRMARRDGRAVYVAQQAA